MSGQEGACDNGVEKASEVECNIAASSHLHCVFISHLEEINCAQDKLKQHTRE